jgi:hypothetical protein
MAKNNLNLKPCPFCGKIPSLRQFSISTSGNEWGDQWMIECDHCKLTRTRAFESKFYRTASGEIVFRKDGLRAVVEAWNHRADAEAPAQNDGTRVAELEKELAAAMQYIEAKKDCDTCRHESQVCENECIGDCFECHIEACTCHDCLNASKWEWRHGHGI